MDKKYDVIVIGSGAAGMMAAIKACEDKKEVLLLEKLSFLGAKLKATGGGKCNLTNTLNSDEFMSSFGRNGKFMMRAISMLDNHKLREFFHSIGVQTDTKDGFRVFPVTHNSSTIIKAMAKKLEDLGVDIFCDTSVEEILFDGEKVLGVKTKIKDFYSSNVILATGGLGFPMLGTTGDGFEFAKKFGHKVTELYPAMLPVIVKEKWVKNCTADTIAKAIVRIDLKKVKKLKAIGDMIFTSKGLRGPVILDFSREITPFLELYGEVPILVNMVKGKNEDEIYHHLKEKSRENPSLNIVELVSTLLPVSVAKELCQIASVKLDKNLKNQEGFNRAELIKILSNTPFTVIESLGFKKAMITRGGISLKEVNPNTMQSKIVKGLYFCGEVLDLDGPCGGYNLQWSFSSGYLAGHLFS